VLGRFRPLAIRLLGTPVVDAGRRVFERYNAAGGGLLAGGLAYAALFAIVPAVLLLVGIVGIVISDEATQVAVVQNLVNLVPPLAELIDTIVSEVAQNAASFSILGAIALLWGTSRFVLGFEGAVGRVMGTFGNRGFVERNLGALIVVVLVIGAIIGASVLSGLATSLASNAPPGAVPLLSSLVSLVATLFPIVAAMAIMALVYQVVPLPHPPWRAAVLPGAVAGLAVAVLASLFVYIAPRLIGTAALLGTLATLFAALAWLSLTFQAILIGAAWVRERADAIAREKLAVP
jgi:membrane protein